MKKRFILIPTALILLILLFTPFIKEPILNFFIKNEFKKNSITLDFLNNKDKINNFFKEDIENNDIFLVGEIHSTSKSVKLNIDFLKFFVENADVRYILLEGGYTMGQLLNEFLISGDFKTLDFIMSSLYGSLAYTQEQYDFFVELYEFNKTLPENKKLMFVGIDIEHQPNIALKYIYSLLPNTEIPEDIKEYFELLNKTTVNNFLINTKKIAMGIKENENSFKEYLGDNFFDFSFSINNMSVSRPGLSQREPYLKSNFTTLYERLPKGKYFGQFGEIHVRKSGAISKSDPVSLANFLNNEYEETKNKVISISLALNNSYVLSQNYVVEGPINNLPASFFPKDGLTKLVKLNYENSPFSKYKLLVKDAPTTEYFEYLLIISDSPACTKYYKNVLQQKTQQ
ncbi:hypothetical protein GNF80_05100 [Clostridium perfringens]|nr:hypothetical protein [Clostridium perfringens]